MCNKIKYTITKKINGFFTKKIMVIVIIFLIISYNKLNYANAEGWNYWEYSMDVILNKYYIIYFLLPLFIIYNFQLMGNEETLSLIRFKSYFVYSIAHIISNIAISILLVGILFLVNIVVGFGKDFSFEWSQISYTSDLMDYFSNTFTNPFNVLVVGILFLISGLSLIGNLIFYLDHFFDRNKTVLIVILIYVLSIIGMVGDMDRNLPFVFLNNYILLNEAANILKDKFFIILIINILIHIMMIFHIKIFWKKRRTTKNERLSVLKWYFKKLFVRKYFLIFISLIIIMNIAITISYNNLSFRARIIEVFSGHGYGYFQITDFLWMFVVNSVVVYILSIFLENETNNQSMHVILRLKSKQQWINSIIIIGSLFIAFYVFLIFIITGIMSSMFKYFFEMNIMDNIEKNIGISFLTILFLTKFLELLFCFISIWVISLYRNNITFSFFLIESMYFLCIVDHEFIKYIPFGISSINRWEIFAGNGGISSKYALFILIMANIIVIFLMKKVMSKKVCFGGK